MWTELTEWPLHHSGWRVIGAQRASKSHQPAAAPKALARRDTSVLSHVRSHPFWELPLSRWSGSTQTCTCVTVQSSGISAKPAERDARTQSRALTRDERSSRRCSLSRVFHSFAQFVGWSADIHTLLSKACCCWGCASTQSNTPPASPRISIQTPMRILRPILSLCLKATLPSCRLDP